ncbi:MAG TPA: hypothetical protein VN025_11280 [Candidatus Dormibacteraeota bacterium]|nr:hypothetical protein [Candidatus Dormibacteraeota bacterium]
MAETLLKANAWLDIGHKPKHKAATRWAEDYRPSRKLAEVFPIKSEKHSVCRVYTGSSLFNLESARSVAVTNAFSIVSPQYIQTINRLINLLELPNGWNSYNARAISKENVTFAVSLLSRIMTVGTPAPQVVPKVRGGVQLEWHTKGINIEVDIDTPEKFSFCAEDVRTAQEAEGNEDVNLLRQWIGRLL